MQHGEAASAAIARCVVLRATNYFGHDFVLAAVAADFKWEYIWRKGLEIQGVSLANYLADAAVLLGEGLR